MLRRFQRISVCTILSTAAWACDQADSPAQESERQAKTDLSGEDRHQQDEQAEDQEEGREDEGHPEDEPGQDGEPGDPASCSDVLFTTQEACVAAAGIDPLDDDLSDSEFEIVARCWQDVANPAFDRCCEATSDDSCIEAPATCDSTPVDEPVDYGDSCAAVLFEVNAACLYEAGSVDGDLDGDCDIRSAEETELVSRCWIEVANGAFDACCLGTPDDTCDTGDRETDGAESA